MGDVHHMNTETLPRIWRKRLCLWRTYSVHFTLKPLRTQVPILRLWDTTKDDNSVNPPDLAILLAPETNELLVCGCPHRANSLHQIEFKIVCMLLVMIHPTCVESSTGNPTQGKT